MAAAEPRGVPGASRSGEEQEPVYEGKAGGTRLRAIHVPLANGFVRTLSVYDAVNVGTHPHLREPALSGALHRLETGEHLAIPFVFHDPQARKLALVVPEMLRHEELALRAKLLAELASDAEHPVPGYAREAASVVGTAGLIAHLERPSGAAISGELSQREAELAARDGALSQRESLLAQRETGVLARESSLGQREAAAAQREQTVEQRARELEAQIEALGTRERRLHARAEDVTRREDELRAIEEEMDAAQADVAMRETELESRFESLAQRESELAQREKGAREDDVVQLVDDEVDEIAEDVDELEALGTSPGELRTELVRPELLRGEEARDAVELVDEPLRAETVPPAALGDAARPHLGGLADEVDELVDDDAIDEVEELDDVEPIGDVTGVHSDLIGDDTDLRRHALRGGTESASTPIALPASEPPPAMAPSVAPPPGFLDARAGGISARAIAEAGGVRIFVRLPEGKDELLREEPPPELLVQLAVVEEQPIVLLTLLDELEGRAHPLRAALDPRAADDRAILENLRRRFAARVAVFSSAGAYLRSVEASGPREVNVARIIERVSRMRTAAAVDVSTAMERVSSAPPPFRAKDHPFVEGEGAVPASASEAAEALGGLAEWSSHDKLDHALLVLSIPHDRVEGTVRRILEHAVEHGLALPGSLGERAVSLGVAPDGASLLARQITAFTATSRLSDRGGLSGEQLADTWERLLKSAAEHEVAIDTETHEVAWKLIREVRGGAGPADIDVAKLPEMGVPELVMLLEHPRHRREAALELCRRKDAALADTVCKSIRKMPRADVVRLVPRLADLGEEAGDTLIDGLDARKTFVRQAFALALGHLKLRRAVVPLVHLLAAEESEVWREIARVVGAFGNASLRNVTRQLREPKGREERYVWTMAHLANHGCAKQIERLTSDETPAVVAMAREALTLRERARSVEAQVLGSLPMTGDDSILQFSRRFYQEMEGKGPADDLEDVPGTDA